MTKKKPNQQIDLLTQAIKTEDPKVAKLLVKRAVQAGNYTDDIGFLNKTDDASFDEVLSLIKGVNLQDAIEVILASQFVSTHLKSMVKLASDNPSDTSHGMMLMRLSQQSLETLQKYRSKGSNINVNYFVKNEGQALIQTNIGKNLDKKGM